jgi:Pyruvate/2-oxoacid:ferredoxin oxidoreductase delta subunit
MKRPMVKILGDKCDGCGACVPACAEGAIEIVDGKAKLIADRLCDGMGACLGDCPQDAIVIEEREADAYDEEAVRRHLATRDVALEQWPIKLLLLHPLNPALRDSDFVLAADCAGFATAAFRKLADGRPFGIACPKLDDPERLIKKLGTLLQSARPRSVTVLRMEVPCCGGLEMLAREAMRRTGIEVPIESEVVEIGPAFAAKGPMTGGCPSMGARA